MNDAEAAAYRTYRENLRPVSDPLPGPSVDVTHRKFTPGPWAIGSTRHAGRYRLITAGTLSHGYVAEVQAHTDGRAFDEKERDANARLIAAAPERDTLLRELYAAIVNTPVLDDSAEWTDFAVRVRKTLDAVDRG